MIRVPSVRQPLRSGEIPSFHVTPASVLLYRFRSEKKHPSGRRVPAYIVPGSLESISRERTVAGPAPGIGTAGKGSPVGGIPTATRNAANAFHVAPPSKVLKSPSP